MTFKEQFFSITAILAFLAILSFAYFSFQINWPPMPALGGSNPTPVAAAPPAPELTAQQKAGEKLFKAYCGACHKMDRLVVGPPLAGIGQKYASEKAWLFDWIRDSQKLVKEGDSKAVALFEEYGGAIMLANPNLTDEDIEAILAFTG